MCPRSDAQEVTEPKFKPRESGSRGHGPQYYVMSLFLKLQLWLLIRITCEFLKILWPRLESPNQLNQKLWRWDLSSSTFQSCLDNSSVQPKLRTAALTQSISHTAKTKALTQRHTGLTCAPPHSVLSPPHSLAWLCYIRRAPHSGPFNLNVLFSVKPVLDTLTETANAPTGLPLPTLPPQPPARRLLSILPSIYC